MLYPDNAPIGRILQCTHHDEVLNRDLMAATTMKEAGLYEVVEGMPMLASYRSKVVIEDEKKRGGKAKKKGKAKRR